MLLQFVFSFTLKLCNWLQIRSRSSEMSCWCKNGWRRMRVRQWRKKLPKNRYQFLSVFAGVFSYVFLRQCLRWIMGVTRRDCVRNMDIKKQLSWMGHCWQTSAQMIALLWPYWKDGIISIAVPSSYVVLLRLWCFCWRSVSIGFVEKT